MPPQKNLALLTAVCGIAQSLFSFSSFAGTAITVPVNPIDALVSGTSIEDPATVLWAMFRESKQPTNLGDFDRTEANHLKCKVFSTYSPNMIYMTYGHLASAENNPVSSSPYGYDEYNWTFSRSTIIVGDRPAEGPLFPAIPGAPQDFLYAKLHTSQGLSDSKTNDFEQIYSEKTDLSYSEIDGMMASTRVGSTPVIDFTFKKSGTYLVFVASENEKLGFIGYCYR